MRNHWNDKNRERKRSSTQRTETRYEMLIILLVCISVGGSISGTLILIDGKVILDSESQV